MLSTEDAGDGKLLTDPAMAERAVALIAQPGQLVSRPDGRMVRVY